jgi:hypothetical protein
MAGFVAFVEGLLPNYVASFLPNSDVVGGVIVVWAFLVFYVGRWWLRKAGKHWRTVIFPTLLIALSLGGLLVGSIIIARKIPTDTASQKDTPGDEQKNRVARIRSKYDRLVSDIAIFTADEARNQPTYPVGKIDFTEWQKRTQLSSERRNLLKAIFTERFTQRILDLLGEMQAAGVTDHVVQTPMWAFAEWPDSNMQKIGVEILKLEQKAEEGKK